MLPGTTADVYEWVESTYPLMDAQTGTEEALTQGIWYFKYGDSVIREKIHDEASQTFTTAYYYWVKIKQHFSDVTRFTTAFDVAKLITDPWHKIEDLCLLGNNRFLYL